MNAIAVFSAGHFGRLVQQGVSQYAQETGRVGWANLVVIPEEMLSAGVFARYRPDGLVVAVWNSECEREILSLGIPAVNVSDLVPELKLPSIAIDDGRVGEVAAEYFLARGYRHFGYIPAEERAGYALRRGSSFAAAVMAAGYRVSWYGNWPRDLPQGAVRASDDLTDWLGALHKPAAIFASEDRTATRLHASVLAAGLHVPEEVSILGVDNDPRRHYMTAGLSSIELPMVQVGYEAAALLDRLLRGEKPARRVTYLPPGEVITRTSSDTHAIDDSDVLEALRFIRQHAHEGIDVNCVARAVAIGRRSLERRFRASMDISPRDEIQRVRVANTCRLLTTTRLSIDEIARASGFQSRTQCFVTFTKAVGMTLRRYRATGRINDGPGTVRAPRR